MPSEKSSETDASATRLATLKQQRSTARGNITRIRNLLESTATSWNVIDLECRLEILSSYIKQLMAYQTEIEKEDPTDEKRGDIEELCISAKSKLLQLLGVYKRRESTVLEQTLGATMLAPSSRLPNLKLPSFGGKYSDYKNFISSFNNLIHEDTTLATIEKFNHLLSCLTGDALRTVKAFQVCEENYNKALDRLAERYDKKCLIFFDNVEQLFAIPKLNKPNASSLRNTVDTVSAIYDSLQSLGSESEITNALIIHLVLSKIDPATKSKWNDQMDYSTLPTWNECVKHLIRRCQSLEVNEDRYSKPEKTPQTHSNHKTSFTCAQTDNENKCQYCKSNSHFIYNCNTFSALPVNQRFDFVKKGGRCINCIKTGHSVRSCTRSHCRVCQRPHHTLLHKYEVQTVSHNATRPSNTNASSQNSNQSSSHHVSSDKDVVILATALVKVNDQFGNAHVVRALLDSGSQINFISEQCANMLKLKQQSKHLQILGIGEQIRTFDIW